MHLGVTSIAKGVRVLKKGVGEEGREPGPRRGK